DQRVATAAVGTGPRSKRAPSNRGAPRRRPRAPDAGEPRQPALRV
ncbi:MAG: hypothetical protein AVDCRST_MAG67-2454, partial [uncultured Solirubrobacteraceae bacterium]